MYKVFFKDRIVFFDSDFQSSFRINTGLFYKYRNLEQLYEIVHAFFYLEKIRHLYLFHPDVEKLKKKFSSCFTQIKASGGLVRKSSGEFLIIRRNDMWDLPKGKNDPGETNSEAAIREVSEECGINGLAIRKEITKTYHTYLLNDKPVLKETTWFEMFTTDNRVPVPQLNENISEARWVDHEAIEYIKLNTYPSILEVFIKSGIL